MDNNTQISIEVEQDFLAEYFDLLEETQITIEGANHQQNKVPVGARYTLNRRCGEVQGFRYTVFFVNKFVYRLSEIV